MDRENGESQRNPKLKDNRILNPFLEYLVPACIDIKPDETLVVYRTQDQIPVDDYGQQPRPLRKFGGNAVNQRLTEEEVRSLPHKKRERIMGEWGLSCNDTEESARKNFLYTYESLKRKGASDEDLDSFVKERGKHICRYEITRETGLITPFDEHGHANLYLYEGVNLETLRDKEYNFKTIDYKNYDIG